jgi:hypothetical protein
LARVQRTVMVHSICPASVGELVALVGIRPSARIDRNLERVPNGVPTHSSSCGTQDRSSRSGSARARSGMTYQRSSVGDTVGVICGRARCGMRSAATVITIAASTMTRRSTRRGHPPRVRVARFQRRRSRRLVAVVAGFVTAHEHAMLLD